MTAFLAERLASEGIDVDPIVGHVNDGTDDVVLSDAWIELAGKRTDVTLSITEYDMQLPGELIVLDRTMVAGIQYSYLREVAEAERQHWKATREVPTIRAIIETNEAEHQAMFEMICESASRRSYLDEAP